MTACRGRNSNKVEESLVDEESARRTGNGMRAAKQTMNDDSDASQRMSY